MKNLIIGVVIFTILFMGLGWLLVGQEPEATLAEFTISEMDQVGGNASASATLVEYSDFECPACGAYYPFVNRLKEELGSDLKIVYRHFPLRNIHKHAQLAAQAAEAASKQGAFWQMHDELFATQAEWSKESDPTDAFGAMAAELELDVDMFLTDMISQEVEDKVNADYQSGLQVGVDSTPSFFINGEKIKNPGSYEVFKSLIESKL